MPSFRTNGAIGALLDEYQRALNDLRQVLGAVSPPEFSAIVDATTPDEDCRSIQTILQHVVRSGYNYAIAVRKWRGEALDYRQVAPLADPEAALRALDEMFGYNERLFADHPDLPLEEFDTAKKIHVRWGQTYDVEQLFEHAIVHVLRHRRQIERFLHTLRFPVTP